MNIAINKKIIDDYQNDDLFINAKDNYARIH